MEVQEITKTVQELLAEKRELEQLLSQVHPETQELAYEYVRQRKQQIEEALREFLPVIEQELAKIADVYADDMMIKNNQEK